MILSAHAKINLTLNVLGKLPNKYHELQTVFYLLPNISDRIEFGENGTDSIEIYSGDSAVQLPLKDNLIYKMAESIRKRYGVNRTFRCAIEKNIPMGAGLGGGSSDAAAALKGLEKLWGLAIPMRDKEELCAGLGSDLNFFLHADASRPVAVGTGRGEHIEPCEADSSWLRIVIMQPHFALSTRDVFTRMNPTHYTPCDEAARNVENILLALKEKDFDLLLMSLNNDLAAPACLVEPQLQVHIDEIARLIQSNNIRSKVMLSGSGSCLFALFDNDDEKGLFVSILNESGIYLKKVYC